MDIEWILTEAVKVTWQFNGAYLAEEIGGSGRRCVISYGAEDGEMRFDGEFVYTEDFMGLVGLLDAVDESPHAAAVFSGDTVSHE